jgi:magnesium transporter
MSSTQETQTAERLSADEIHEAWLVLSADERLEAMRVLPRDEAEDLFFALNAIEQAQLVMAMPPSDRRSWVRLLPPDDAADLVQASGEDNRAGLIALLDPVTKAEVTALLAYAEDEAGGLMSPRYAQIRPDMTVSEALTYLGKQPRERLENIHYAYVIDPTQRLVGTMSVRELFIAPREQKVNEAMRTELVTAHEEMDQEQLALLFRNHGLNAIPVVDAQGRMKGIVTLDDIVDAVEEEATEDFQKLGGTEALEEPYLTIKFWRMVKKRGVWLAVLFVGEMLTATAMAFFEDEIARAVVLALFVPLIISSGGNSGSQATTLVIRAMALGEIRLRDWWRVVRREIATGAVLGALLGAGGLLRVVLWGRFSGTYGPHYFLVGITVMVSLAFVVVFGTVVGSMLPFLLRRAGLDPASASAPFVATLVDVTGLVIYFAVAATVLTGTQL